MTWQEKRLSTWIAAESNPLSSVDAPPGSPPMDEQLAIAACTPSNLPAGLNPKDFCIVATGGAGDCRVRLWKMGGGACRAASTRRLFAVARLQPAVFFGRRAAERAAFESRSSTIDET